MHIFILYVSRIKEETPNMNKLEQTESRGIVNLASYIKLTKLFVIFLLLKALNLIFHCIFILYEQRIDTFLHENIIWFKIVAFV